ncbi:MAG: hypothetical protein AMXMBFR58_27320 [Phycisphaerae bacterium]|nr:Transcriptional regulatory protein LiaR [Phycisphaerales bacterium]MCK6477138.1 response regulator transcription factor [Phycisphaerales bacterium]
MIRVLFVDDEPRLRSAWERLFAGQADFKLVGTLESADGLGDVAARVGADIIVLDLSMPGADPLEIVKQMSEKGSAARVVMYSGHCGIELMQSAFDAGAWAFVDKLAPTAELFDVLRRVAAGEVVLPPRLSIRRS